MHASPVSEFTLAPQAGEFLASPCCSMCFTQECGSASFNRQILSHTAYSLNQLDVKATGKGKWWFVQYSQLPKQFCSHLFVIPPNSLLKCAILISF